MHVFYCKKCKQDSLTPICDHCGAQIASLNQAERYKWRYIRTPLGDTPTLLGAGKALSLTVITLLLLMFLGELIFSPDKRLALTMFTSSGLLPSVLIFSFLAAALICLFLGLQGREEMHFVLDARGAHVQTWIVPSRLKCAARFIPYEVYNIAEDVEGNQRMLVSESHLLWADVCRVEIRRRACRIDLYRPSGFRFMSLYPDRPELEAIENYIMPKMKQLAKR
ncbi:MAG: hypothetical protein IJ157_07395 [Clostridia bacterium]|nr:hypothetical protein [Clostridia bacterium]